MDFSKEALRIIFGKEHYSKQFINDEKLKDVIKEILCGDAYRDMQPRHFKGIGEHKKEVADVFDRIADIFVEYFRSDDIINEGQFDEWHKKCCEELKDGFTAIKVEYGEKMTVGKAQKLINITFKHLYLFSDAKEEKFVYCHVPLDSFILEWGMRNAVIDKDYGVWSKLENDAYYEIQRSFRERLKAERFQGHLLLEDEFYIWEEAKLDKSANVRQYRFTCISINITTIQQNTVCLFIAVQLKAKTYTDWVQEGISSRYHFSESSHGTASGR